MRRQQHATSYAPLFPYLGLAANAVVAEGELAVVNFAGGGGASEGIARALNRPVNIAVNHDPVALGMHRINHPHTTHYIEDVWHVDPREATGGHPVALAQFSPDCTHFSKARGGKPRSKRVRGLAWVAVRWADTVRPRVIVLENVEEFVTWGPLDASGDPIEAQQGRTFRSFVNALRRLGYAVEHRVLRACDFGAGTSRERFFLIARCDGLPTVWPSPTHAAPDDVRVVAGQLQPWPVAADFIDWSVPARSVFGRKKAIVQASRRRIAIGFEKYMLNTDTPYIVPDGHAGAFIAKTYGGTYDGPGLPLTGTIDTVTTVDHHQLVTAQIAVYYGNNGKGEPGQAADVPLRTIPSTDRFGLSLACLYRNFGTSNAADVLAPAPTIMTTGAGKIGVTTAELAPLPTIDMLTLAREVYDLLMEHLGPERLGSAANHDERLVTMTVNGLSYLVWDLRFRMFKPRELYLCQGFGPDYVIDRTADGRRLTVGEQTHMCGNSVPPHPMKALTLSNLAMPWAEAAD